MNEASKLFTLSIPQRGIDLLTMNKQLHRMQRHRIHNDWKEATTVAVGRLRPPAGGFPPAWLEWEIHFKLHRVRDPHNYEPTLKPIVDHLVKHFKFWPDDNPEFLSSGSPELRVGGRDCVEGVIIRAYARP